MPCLTFVDALASGRLLRVLVASSIAFVPFVACSGSSDGSSAASAGPADSAAAESPLPAPDGGAPSSLTDAATPDGASKADGSSDAGPTGSGSKPPFGSMLCGHGVFSPAESIALCQSAIVPDLPGVIHTSECTANQFTFSSGLWEAWCSATGTYLFARFDGRTSGFGTGAPFAEYAVGNSAGSADAWMTNDLSSVLVSASVTAHAPNEKEGILFLEHFQSFSPAYGVVGAVKLRW